MTTSPTTELRRHHDIEEPAVDTRAFRQAWRIRTRLDGLLGDELITPGQWQAAVDYRNAWGRVRAIAGAGSTLRVSAGGGDPEWVAIERLDAFARIDAVEAVIGALATALCQACVIEDYPWARTARLTRRDPHTVRHWTVLAIRSLAAAWTRAGRHAARWDQSSDRGTPRRRPGASLGASGGVGRIANESGNPAVTEASGSGPCRLRCANSRFAAQRR